MSATWRRGDRTIRSASSEMFGFRVCTARWLAEHPPPKGFEFLRSTILLDRWDYATLARALGDLCLHTEGADWGALSTRLSRYGRLESEEYKP
jgi:hypothetical protein